MFGVEAYRVWSKPRTKEDVKDFEGLSVEPQLRGRRRLGGLRLCSDTGLHQRVAFQLAFAKQVLALISA